MPGLLPKQLATTNQTAGQVKHTTDYELYIQAHIEGLTILKKPKEF